MMDLASKSNSQGSILIISFSLIVYSHNESVEFPNGVGIDGCISICEVIL